MFAHSKELSQEYYQVNKVGNLMSLYTNDLDTVQECFGDGILMFCDALFLGLLAVIKMWRMNHFLTGLSMIPMAFLMAAGTTLGKYLMKKWEERQAAFSELSDFAQENYSGLAVIKAFVKETKELMMFRRLNRENEDINVEYTKISTLLNIMVTLFVESVICVNLRLRRLSRLLRKLRRRPACRVYRLFLGRCMADHGGLHADREDIPWKSVLKPYYGTA